MLIYIDESYHPRKRDPKRPEDQHGVVAALCVSEKTSAVIDRKLFGLKKKHFGDKGAYTELHASEFLRKRVFLKRDEIDYCKRQWNLVTDFFEQIDGRSSLRIFGVVAPLLDEVPEPEEWIEDLMEGDILPGVTYDHYLLLWNIDDWMIRNYPDEWAHLVFDNRDKNQMERMSIQYSRLFHRAKTRNTYSNIVPLILFADSALVAGLQYVDMVAGCVRQYHDVCKNNEGVDIPGGLDDFSKEICKFYEIIQRKMEDAGVEGGFKGLEILVQ